MDLLDQRRPRRADAARNFDGLLAAARTVLDEVGDAASLEAIAKLAGVGIGTLYRNFPTRDDLVDAVYLADVHGLCSSSDDLQQLTPWDGLINWLGRCTGFLASRPALVTTLGAEGGSCRSLLYATGEPLLVRAQADGVAVRSLDLDDVMRLIFGITRGSYASAEQRTRVFAAAINGIRA